MKDLVVLEVGGTLITNAGLPYLKGLVNLEYLDLGPSDVSDAGVEHLLGLKRLRVLYVPDRVSEKARTRLQEALPAVRFEGRAEDIFPGPGIK